MPPAKPEPLRDEDLLDLSATTEEGAASPADLADADDLGESLKVEASKKTATTFGDALLLGDEKTGPALPGIDLGVLGDAARGVDAEGLDEFINGLGPGDVAKSSIAPVEEDILYLDEADLLTGDADIHEALVDQDEAKIPGAEDIMPLVEECVATFTKDLRATLRVEFAAEIKFQVEQAVPREAVRIIREEIATLIRELAAEQD